MQDEMNKTCTTEDTEEGSHTHNDFAATMGNTEGKESLKGSEESSSPNAKLPTLVDVLTTWSEGTSVHGVCYALKHDSFKRWKRLLWAFVIVAFFGIMIWFISELIAEYFKYDTESSISHRAPDSLPFPQVTICNTNMYQQSKVTATGIRYPIDDEQVHAISQSIEDFFDKAGGTTKFNLESTPSKEAWKPLTTHNGLCWVFNTDEMVKDPGEFGGLSFNVNLDQAEYLDETPVAGAFVYITEPGALITSRVPHVFVKPGELNLLLVKSTEYIREASKPWSTCRSKPSDYTQSQCQGKCWYTALVTNCKCRGLGDSREIVKSLPICTPTSPCAWKSSICDCLPPPCHEKVYTVQSSAVPYANAYLTELQQSLNVSTDVFRENVVGVRINYDLIREEISTERKVQTVAGLLAAIGGQMGLWAGISVISILEIFGELCSFRLLPRLWGDRRLYGIGGKE